MSRTMGSGVEQTRAGRRLGRDCLLYLISTILCCFGVITLICYQSIFNTILQSQLTIGEGSAAYNAWLETPLPVFTKFYFFDMVNPRDLFYKNEKPILEERGPYVFRQVERKVGLVWHNNGTVSYRRLKFWYFHPELSVGTLNDTVRTINVPVVGSAEFVRGDFFLEWGISDLLSTLEATIFIRRTVRELLFEGYEDAVMELGESVLEQSGEYQDEFSGLEDYNESGSGEEEEQQPGQEERNTVPLDKFGWFYKRNGTDWADGELAMMTGEGDISRLGEIVSWNRQTQHNNYPGRCGQVRGSADGLFPPGAAAAQTLELFSTDLCRPLKLRREGVEKVQGIPAIAFNLDPDNFANTTVCPDNQCYSNNLPSGVQNVTQCKMESPTFVSRPHFYLADEMYLRQFQYGVAPDPARHSSAFLLEPTSSIPVRVQMRLQLNVLLRKVEGIDYLFKNLPEVMFPVFWFDTSTSLPEVMATQLSLLLSLPIIMQVCGGLSVAGAVLLAISVLLVRRRQQGTGEILAGETPGGERGGRVEWRYSKVPPPQS